jgi:hypothetical protein
MPRRATPCACSGGAAGSVWFSGGGFCSENPLKRIIYIQIKRLNRKAFSIPGQGLLASIYFFTCPVALRSQPKENLRILCHLSISFYSFGATMLSWNELPLFFHFISAYFKVVCSAMTFKIFFLFLFLKGGVHEKTVISVPEIHGMQGGKIN